MVVSHSARLARGVVELAREMAGPQIALEAVGGLDEPGDLLGTDALQVLEAIQRIWSEDGVLMLMDLGSAVLSAESALDLLPAERRKRVVLCPAPLVEGAVAAAVAARVGEPLGRVVEEALGGLRPKAEHLGDGSGGGEDEAERGAEPAPVIEEASPRLLRLEISNPFGLHARPATRLIQAASHFQAVVTLTNLTTGKGPASARSLSAIATLGVRQGDELLVEARGLEAAEVLAALGALAARNFGDPLRSPVPPEPGATTARPEGAPPGPAIEGLTASPGIAIGPARRLAPPAVDAPFSREVEEPEEEATRLSEALQAVAQEIRRARERIRAGGAEEEADILNAHLLLLQDEELLGPVRRLIFEEGMDAARAWRLTAEAVRARFDEIEDAYLRARAEDVAGIARGVMERLGGIISRPRVEGPGILVASSLSPSEAAVLNPKMVHGIVTASGGPTSHAGLLVRSLGIPAVMGLGETVLAIEEGTELLLDAGAGLLYPHPSKALLQRYRLEIAARASEASRARSRARAPAVTRDGYRLEVHANIGAPEAVEPALAAGAEGVGLLRTEFLFLEREDLPGEEEQEAAYGEIARALAGKPLILRTLDVGGDKPMPALGGAPGANPSLGLRGIRQGLARPEVLVTQLRAALKVAARYPLKIMFPMVATLEEYRAAVAVLHREREGLAARGLRPCEGFEVGVMVEVPSLALTADRFAPEVDFFSIGTNDLSQYVLAADRGDERVAALADPLHPAMLRLVRQVVEAARRRGRWVGVCGEAASDPEAAPLLLGLGVSELSVAAPAIPAVKDLIRELSAGSVRPLAEAALERESAREVRRLVAEHLAPRGLPAAR